MAELLRNLYQRYLEDPGALEADGADAVASDIHSPQEYARAHSSVFVHWAGLKAIALTEYKKQKAYVEEDLWGHYWWEHRTGLDNTLDKPPSNAIVDMDTKRDPRYREAVNNLRRYGETHDLLDVIVNALWQRRDMLKALCWGDSQDWKSTTTTSIGDVDIIKGRGEHMTLEQKEEVARSVLNS